MRVSISGELASRHINLKTEAISEFIKELTKVAETKTWTLSEVLTKNNKPYLVLE